MAGATFDDVKFVVGKSGAIVGDMRQALCVACALGAADMVRVFVEGPAAVGTFSFSPEPSASSPSSTSQSVSASEPSSSSEYMICIGRCSCAALGTGVPVARVGELLPQTSRVSPTLGMPLCHIASRGWPSSETLLDMAITIMLLTELIKMR